MNNFGEIEAVYGAVGATLLSRVLFVVGTMVFRKKKLKVIKSKSF